MKLFAISFVSCGLAFVFMGFQLGMFDEPAEEIVDRPFVEERPQEKPKRASFPNDLAPAARSQPVPQAAAFNADDKHYPMVFLKTSGALYQDFQERMTDGWAAESVERTQLAVILGPHKKVHVESVKSPPVARYRWEMEVTVIEAQSGKALASRTFVNLPRPVRSKEPAGLIEIGAPVSFKTVFTWVVANARAGFPEPASAEPIVHVVQ